MKITVLPLPLENKLVYIVKRWRGIKTNKQTEEEAEDKCKDAFRILCISLL